MKFKTFMAFTGPSNIVMSVLLIFPLLYAFWLGLHFITFRTIKDPVYVGLSNYSQILDDPAFWAAMRWTLVVIVVTVPAHMILGFLIALLLDQMKGRMRAFYLAASLIPMIVVPLVGTIIFKQLFDPSGLFAWAYKSVTGDIFVFNETSMKQTILAHTVWISTPWATILFFARVTLALGHKSIKGSRKMETTLLRLFLNKNVTRRRFVVRNDSDPILQQ